MAAEQSLRDEVARRASVDVAQLQGFYAERWHTGTFNVDATLKRVEQVIAFAPASTAANSPDISLRIGDDIVREYSLKYYKDAFSSVQQQRGYGDQGRIIPSDQHAEAPGILQARIAREYGKPGPNRADVAHELEEVQRHLDDRIRHDGAQSQPLSRGESAEHTRNLKAGQGPLVQPQIGFDTLLTESLRAGAVAGGLTLAVALAPRILSAIRHRVQAGDWPPDVLRDLAEGTLAPAGIAALRATVATSITLTARSGILGQTLQGVDPTGVGVLTFLMFEGFRDFRRYRSRSINGESFADGMLRKGFTALAGAGGAAVVGQILIPIPVVGSFLGATVGSIAAQCGYAALETSVESWWRSSELDALVTAYGDLSSSWDLFLDDFAHWQTRTEALRFEFARLCDDLRHGELVVQRTHRSLRDALSEDWDDGN